MKVWQHGKGCVVAEYGDRHIDPYQCYNRDCGGSWMQLVPADARIVTSSDPELRETIIGLMTSRDWYDWPTDEQYLQECVTEALDGLGKTANV